MRNSEFGASNSGLKRFLHARGSDSVIAICYRYPDPAAAAVACMHVQLQLCSLSANQAINQ